MTVRLHRCRFDAFKRGHSCWRVEGALQEMGVPYEVVHVPTFPRGRRTEVIAGTGQSRVPALELEDGTWWREESAAMARAIRAGKLARGQNA